MQRIHILKLDGSNYRNVLEAVQMLGFTVCLTPPRNLSKLHSDSTLIIPGIGHISSLASQVTDQFGIDNLRRLIASRNLYTIGICLGFHFLCESSSEDDSVDCLNLFPVRITRIHENCAPEVGWREISIDWLGDRSEGDMPISGYFYFSHSYGGVDVTQKGCYETGDGRTIIGFYNSKRLTGFQFHPEKSGTIGLKLLEKVLSRNSNSSI